MLKFNHTESAGGEQSPELGTIEERVNRVVEVLERVVRADGGTGSQFAKRVTARLNSSRGSKYNKNSEWALNYPRLNYAWI